MKKEKAQGAETLKRFHAQTTIEPEYRPLLDLKLRRLDMSESEYLRELIQQDVQSI